MYGQDEVKRTGETGVEETILEGHIGITKELLAFQTPEKKFYIGCEKGGANLIKVGGRGRGPPHHGKGQPPQERKMGEGPSAPWLEEGEEPTSP